jgi:hypothetical protein
LTGGIHLNSAIEFEKRQQLRLPSAPVDGLLHVVLLKECVLLVV